MRVLAKRLLHYCSRFFELNIDLVQLHDAIYDPMSMASYEEQEEYGQSFRHLVFEKDQHHELL